jgi:TonB family protein
MEQARISRRTRRSQGLSFLVHLLLLAWLVLQPHVFPEPPAVTEIAWIDAGSLKAAGSPPAPAQSPEAEPDPGREIGQARPERVFERRLERADRAPVLQASRALQDVLASRLTSLQREAQAGPVRPAAVRAPIAVTGPAHPTSGQSAAGTPLSLARLGPGAGAGPGAEPATLVRAGTGLPATSLPQLATVSAPRMERSRPQDVDTNGRDLAGASLLGPVADRAIMESATPAYPGWAEVQGVEASVSLYFVVRPDGRIKENILVEKTSGFEDFDGNAVAALRRWRFQALGPGAHGEQWGRITFNFRLSAG